MMLQGLGSNQSPLQRRPTLEGSGKLQVLTLLCCPPHFSLQEDHSPQSAHSPSTGTFQTKLSLIQFLPTTSCYLPGGDGHSWTILLIHGSSSYLSSGGHRRPPSGSLQVLILFLFCCPSQQEDQGVHSIPSPSTEALN